MDDLKLSGRRGSPVDVLVFLGLMVVGLRVLGQRQLSLSEILEDNPWITLFIAYCFISILWSDFPFLALKRWIKILGHPIMVLVLFTEPELKQALLTVMKRCAYVLFPVSILWIKYFPELGRKWDEYGSVMNSGVTTGKNAMGNMFAIFGLFSCGLLQLLRKEKTPSRWREFQLTLCLLLMIAYCLLKAHSATSDICLVLGAGIIVAFGLRSLNKRVIAPRARGIQHSFGEDDLIYFKLGDSKDLAAKFDFVFRHPRAVEQIVKRGQRVYQNHTWSGEKANLLSCFAEIA